MSTTDDQVALVRKILRTEQGLEMGLPELAGERISVTFFRPDIVRLRISRQGKFEEKPSYAVPDAIGQMEPARIRIEEFKDRFLIGTDAMEVSLFFDPFHVEIRRNDGSPVLVSSRDAAGRRWFYREEGEGFCVGRGIEGQDGVYGLGEKTGSLNKNGRAWKFWNTDVLNPNVAGGHRETPHENPLLDPTSTQFDPYYVSIPFYLHRPFGSSLLAGSFFNNLGRSSFDFTQPGEALFRFESGAYEEFVFSGPHLPGVLRGYTGLTGRISLPPLWALGHHQCRWHNYNQEQVKALGARYRLEQIPCDVLWIDIDHMDGYRVFTWDQQKFPDPPRLLRELEKEKFRLITIIDPGIKEDPGYPVYDEAIRERLVCLDEQGNPYVGQVWPGRTVFPDFTLEQARRWWGRLNARHVQVGIAGIWNDMNEPATGDVPAEGMRFDHGRSDHDRFHNEYALLMAMGTVEGLKKAMPGKRTFVLSRAGSPGIQRYAANWLGDNCSRWEHLGLAVRMALGMGLSGQPFVGADVGGFMEACSAELLVRWYQYAAFTPFCRNHNTAAQPDQYPWSFGPEALRLIRKALQHRYFLMPYLYSQFLIASETGLPIQRPLALGFSRDLKSWEVEDQFLLGEHMLVAPVLAPGATQRSVYLPAGHWYQWPNGTHEISKGECRVTPVDLESMPVWIRGGAVIPCWPEVPLSTMGFHPEVIDLHVFFPGENGTTESVLQEDDGLTENHRLGQHLRTALNLHRRGEQITLRGTVSGRRFPEFRRNLFRLRLHAPKGETWSPVSLPASAAGFEMSNRGEDFQVEFRRVG